MGEVSQRGPEGKHEDMRVESIKDEERRQVSETKRGQKGPQQDNLFSLNGGDEEEKGALERKEEVSYHVISTDPE